MDSLNEKKKQEKKKKEGIDQYLVGTAEGGRWKIAFRLPIRRQQRRAKSEERLLLLFCFSIEN